MLCGLAWVLFLKLPNVLLKRIRFLQLCGTLLKCLLSTFVGRFGSIMILIYWFFCPVDLFICDSGVPGHSLQLWYLSAFLKKPFSNYLLELNVAEFDVCIFIIVICPMALFLLRIMQWSHLSLLISFKLFFLNKDNYNCIFSSFVLHGIVFL